MVDIVNMDQPLLDSVKQCAEQWRGKTGREKYLNTLFGDYGALCVILHSNGGSTNHSGYCHVGINYFPEGNKVTSVAILSWPYTTREPQLTAASRDAIGLTPDFLDAYYTWLSTSPIFEGVFLEPWNGEYFVINPSSPANVVLFACICSRAASEFKQLGKLKEWVELVQGGVGWPLSLVVADGFTRSIDRGRRAYSFNPVQGMGHAPFNRIGLSHTSLVSIVNEVPISKVAGATISAPYNRGGEIRRTFAIYGGGTPFPDHLIAVSKEIVKYQSSGEGWNMKEKYNEAVGGYMEQFLPHVLKWQAELSSIGSETIKEATNG